MTLAILADIGGTNTRVALAEGTRVRIDSIRRFPNAEYQARGQDIAQVLRDYLDQTGATVSGAIPGAPVSLNGDALLAPLDVGSARLVLRASVDVRVPLVGSKIEKMLGGQLTELMQIEQRFTTEWIAGRR